MAWIGFKDGGFGFDFSDGELLGGVIVLIIVAIVVAAFHGATH